MSHTVVAEGLEHPWGLALLPDGRWLVTEKPGRLRIITAEGNIGEPITGLPRVDARGQGGLLDVIVGPTFAQDRLIYWSYAEPRDGGNGTAVARGRLADDGRSVENAQVIFRAQPTYDGDKHFGSALAFGRNGHLFITLGERSDRPMRPQAQDLGSHMGKVIRINADGSVPTDNPFVNQQGALPEIWSLGHRNVQGAAIQPGTGALYTVEHGTRGGDEVNLTEAGKNYGWPEVAYGIEYNGQAIPAVTARVAGPRQCGFLRGRDVPWLARQPAGGPAEGQARVAPGDRERSGDGRGAPADRPGRTHPRREGRAGRRGLGDHG